ncbi:hypothetical protein K440DRAFT_632018 [Wilcoxina mikolae CBS 423.85]|nr:hypothetical protein K440DRAFT_632018 [Wilcoxina mikolae CBS 423.85]
MGWTSSSIIYDDTFRQLLGELVTLTISSQKSDNANRKRSTTRFERTKAKSNYEKKRSRSRRDGERYLGELCKCKKGDEKRRKEAKRSQATNAVARTKERKAEKREPLLWRS